MTQPLSGNAPGEEVGRNAPCPCGSGKKFKRCHGKVETPKISPMKIKVEGAEPRAGGAWAEQLKAAGMDPNQVDPNAMMNMQKMLARMPKGQLQRIQALMQKAMAGKDVSREAQELERSLPPDMLAQMQAMSGMMGGMPGMGAPEGEEQAIEAEAAEVAPEMSADEARKIVEKAVAEGKLTREAAEQLLAGGGGKAVEGAGADTEGAEESGEGKKGFWKKLTRR